MSHALRPQLIVHPSRKSRPADVQKVSLIKGLLEKFLRTLITPSLKRAASSRSRTQTFARRDNSNVVYTSFTRLARCRSGIKRARWDHDRLSSWHCDRRLSTEYRVRSARDLTRDKKHKCMRAHLGRNEKKARRMYRECRHNLLAAYRDKRICNCRALTYNCDATTVGARPVQME